MAITDIIPVTKEVELQGKVYKVSPITIGDMAEFESRTKKKHDAAKEQKLRFAQSAYPNDLPTEVFKEINVPLTEAELDAEAGTIDGCAFLLWCSLRQSQPEITEADARKLITIDKTDEILKAIGLGEDVKSKNVKTPAASG